jgi:TonB family protein
MDIKKLRTLLPLFITLILVVGCGSSKEFNTIDGFMPESDLPADELEQLREQVVDHSDLDEMPQVAGGMSSIFMGMRYPEDARRAGAGGRVLIDFIVDLDGNARDLIVSESAGYGMDEEVIRLVRSATFIPARRNGEAVVARQNLPITFNLP